MSEHTDRVRDSVAASNLRECVELLRPLSQVDWDIEEARDLITRLMAVTENVLGRLTIADRNLVPGNTIDVLEGQSQRILELIKSLEDSAPSVDIDLLDASNRIDEILATASSLPVRGILKKCVNSQAVYPLSEQHGLKARERRYTAHEEGKHWE